MDHPGVRGAAVIAMPHPHWLVPAAFAVIDAIPRPGSGTFLKRALRKRYRRWYTSA